MTSRAPADAAVRAEALDTAASIILQAPAGSGKTTILTQRFLALLPTVDTPESILAMTFTRKAAAEMRERILGALRAAAADAPRKPEEMTTWRLARAAREHAQARGWRLEDHPARLRILTIDALNHSLAAALPVAARGAASLALVDNAQALYREVARRTLQDAESDPTIAPHSGHVFQLFDNSWERLEEALAQMLGRRAEWLRHVFDASPAELQADVERHLQALATAVLERIDAVFPVALRSEAQSLATEAVAALKAARPDSPLIEAWSPLVTAAGKAPRALGTGVGDLPAWRAIASMAFTDSSSDAGPPFRKAVNIGHGFPPTAVDRKKDMMAWLQALQRIPGLGEALEAVRDAPSPTLEAGDAKALESILSMLRYAAAELRLRFREAGQSDHVQVAFDACEALEHAQGGADDGDMLPSARALHQGTVLRHVLIDEFQDTSHAQFRLLEALVADWSGTDGRTLFAVGDPMQSIYQFREADVGLFTQAKTHGVGRVELKPLALTANFRSQPAVVDFVNETFGRIFPPQPSSIEAAVPYLRFEANTDATPRLRTGVELHALRGSDDREADEVREAMRIRAVIEDARRKDPAATIAVLVSVRNHATRIVDALRAADIAVQGVDLVPLAEAPVVQDLVSLTRAIVSPTDRVAWLSVLRAPWCGLGLADLTQLFAGRPRATVAELLADDRRRAGLSPEGAQRLQRVWPLLEAAAAAAAMPIALRVESLWLHLDGPRAYADTTALEDARRYLDTLADETAATGRLEPAHLNTLLEGLFAGGDSIASGAVQVMTIHRAKGLEFDLVVLPGLNRRPRHDIQGLLDWISWEDDADGTERRLLAPTHGTRRDGEQDLPGSLRATLRAMRSARQSRERARLLYVAMTRARTALHLFATLKPAGGKKADPSSPSPAAPSARGSLGVLWPALGPAFTDAWHRDDGRGVDGAVAAPGLTRLRNDLAPPAWPEDAVFERLSLPSAELLATPENGWASDMARLAGTVVHRELERLARMEPLPEAASVEGDRPRLRALLAAEGVVDEELETATERVVGALRTTLSRERGRWILARHPLDDFVEHELTGVYEGRIENIVIDRTFVDADGTRWVIDHKTSWHEGGDLEAFVAERRDAYASQLRKYKAFASRLGPQPVRTALYFPLLGGRFEEYDPG
ncbi:MAG: hypothetical protein EBS39_05200 [Gammaproteobacteria bacterium]|nr:hypothetical protein [Gammaproteobacteria bacterium]